MRRLGATLALLVVLALSGCGDSDEPNDFGTFFGIAPSQTPNESDFARMANGGIGSYRVVLSWASVERSAGQYDWSAYDALVTELAKAGLEPTPLLVGTPPIYEDKATDPPTSSPETFDAWAAFLKEAAERYGPGGSFWDTLAALDPSIEPRPFNSWEIWNEPNSSLFWTPRPDPQAYADLIKRSARVLRAVDPATQIVSGGMFATPASAGAIESTDFLDAIYDVSGVSDAIDVVGVHPYGPDLDSVTAQLDGTRKAIDDAGDDAGTWVTEIGWGSNPAPPSDLAKTPRQQADLLSSTFQALYDDRETWGLRGIDWFTWLDSDTVNTTCGWCAAAGLVDADRDSKPAWIAFTDLTGGTP
jgi:hypothetical protein